MHYRFGYFHLPVKKDTVELGVFLKASRQKTKKKKKIEIVFLLLPFTGMNLEKEIGLYYFL